MMYWEVREMIVINDVTIDSQIHIEQINAESNEYKVEFEVLGKNNFKLYSAILKEEIVQVEIPEFEQKFEGKINNLTSSYREILDEETIVAISFVVKEKTDKDKEWNVFDGLFQTAVANWARTRAISKILIKNNLTTQEEYENLISEILESDFEEMKEFIFKGK